MLLATSLLFFLLSTNAQEGKIYPTPSTNVDTSFMDAFSFSIEYDEQEERINCSSVDQRQNMANQGLPDRRDQDTTGWCYAFATADLLSYHFGINVSPADIAQTLINQNSERFSFEEMSPAQQRFPLGGGFINLALEAMNEQGVCSDEDYPSEDRLVSEIELNSRQIENTNSEPQCIDCLTRQIYQELFPAPELLPLFDLISNEEFKRVLMGMARGECSNRLHSGERYTIHSVWYQDPGVVREDITAIIDKAINNEQIVGIGFDSSILSKPTSFMGSRINHAATIVGRRFNESKGRCEFLIRNSEMSCPMYNEDYDCENNHIWVPRQIVTRGIGGAYTID